MLSRFFTKPSSRSRENGIVAINSTDLHHLEKLEEIRVFDHGDLKVVVRDDCRCPCVAEVLNEAELAQLPPHVT